MFRLLLCAFPVIFLSCCGLSAAAQAAGVMPDAPQQQQPALQSRPDLTPEQAAEAMRQHQLPLVNGMPYVKPTLHTLLTAYAHDTYGPPGLLSTTIRATYGFARDKPTQWGQDFPGYAERWGSAEGVTVINGNVRLGMEVVFHEDLRYIPCHGCSFKHKLENALLAEVTARHGENGQRFFSLTPAISDFSGPIISHSAWSPEGFDPFAGVVATRVVAATRIGLHLAQEYWGDRHRKRELR